MYRSFSPFRIALSILAALICITINEAQCKITPVAIVTGNGPLRINRGAQAMQANVGMVLYNGDGVSAGRTRAVILLRDGTEVKMDRGARLVLGEKAGKEKIMVSSGKIFAQVPERGSRAQCASLQGKVKGDGSEFQMEVTKSGTICTVAKGQARFSTGKGSVLLSAGHECRATSPDSAPGVPRQVSLSRVIAWQKDLVKYYKVIPTVIASFTQAFNQAVALKNASGTGSLMQAQPAIERMKELEGRLSEMVPDDRMLTGHNKLKSAFATMETCLVLTSPNQQLVRKAQQDLAFARAEVAKWKPVNDAMEKRFVSNPWYVP